MSDRATAEIFGKLFKLMQGGQISTSSVWNLAKDCDFSPYQMDCDEALMKLGLLWQCENEDCNGYDEAFGGAYNYGPKSESTRCSFCGWSRPT